MLKSEQEAEGIRRLKEIYSPEMVEEILVGIRHGLDDVANGRVITFEEYLKKAGIKPDDIGYK